MIFKTPTRDPTSATKNTIDRFIDSQKEERTETYESRGECFYLQIFQFQQNLYFLCMGLWPIHVRQK